MSNQIYIFIWQVLITTTEEHMASELLREKERIARGELGYHYYNSLVLDTQRPSKSVDGTANVLLSMAIKCLIVGMEAEGRQLLGKANLWLSTALNLLGPSMDRLSDLTLCGWLSEPPAASPDPARYTELLKEYLAAHGEGRDNKATLDFILPRLVDVGEVGFCTTWYEARWPSRHPSVATVRRFGPTGMAYLLARHRTTAVLSDEEMAAAQVKFLSGLVPDYIKRGQYRDFAMWVKVLTEAPAGEAAREAILKVAQKYA